jgi:DNA mismatch endonuclease (patch repair protein)
VTSRHRYPNPTSASVSAVMRGNRKWDTSPEVRIRSLLHAQGYRFRKNMALALGSTKVRPDIVFTRYRLAIFVDGCFWHRCPVHGTSPRANQWYWGPKLDRNVKRDQLVNEALRAAGWTVVRVWEHESPESAIRKVEDALNSPVARAKGKSP